MLFDHFEGTIGGVREVKERGAWDGAEQVVTASQKLYSLY